MSPWIAVLFLAIAIRFVPDSFTFLFDKALALQPKVSFQFEIAVGSYKLT
jgi:hypothetical protein